MMNKQLISVLMILGLTGCHEASSSVRPVPLAENVAPDSVRVVGEKQKMAVPAVTETEDGRAKIVTGVPISIVDGQKNAAEVEIGKGKPGAVAVKKEF